MHYRCRCGQEVVLRPRDGVYLVVGALVGLSLLNTALLLFLWWKVDNVPTPEGGEDGGGTASREEAAPDPSAGNPASDDPATADELDRSGVDPTGPEIAAPDRGSPPSDAVDGSGSSSTDPSVEPDDGPPPVAAIEPSTELTLRLARPAGLETALLPVLVETSAAGSLDRTLLLLAAARWGEEFASRAADLLRIESPALFEALTPPPEGDPDLLLVHAASARSAAGTRGEFAALERVWDTRWPVILRRIEEEPTIGWVAELARAGGGEPVDLVVLVDLSASMESEVAAARAALGSMLPALLAARPDWRFGWIGYRDEVVDRTPLTRDERVLLESLTRWRTEGGGDVPEALDEALFEAFRVGGFPWRPDARHRFVVLGDAPPPYERIEGMVELAGAAHESPEGFVVDVLGIVRESEFPTVPGFDALADAAGGRSVVLEEGEDLAPLWWELLAGDDAPAWTARE